MHTRARCSSMSVNWPVRCWPALIPGCSCWPTAGSIVERFGTKLPPTGAQLLWRVQSSAKLHVVTELADGSYLSVLLTDIERQRLRRHRARGLDTVPPGHPKSRSHAYKVN